MSIMLVRQVLEDRDLEMHFMPIVRFSTRDGTARWSPYGYEALIRGPSGSALRRPDELFAAASAAGLREDLELLCLEKAFELLPAIPGASPLFLNISADVFLSGGFERLLTRWKARLPGMRLVFELVDGEVPDTPRLWHQVEALQAQGFRFLRDDLRRETGSPAQDRDMAPVEFLKLHRGFLRQLGQDPVEALRWLETVCKIAGTRGAQVIVEGVETPHIHHLSSLSEAGVALAQGYLFGEPAILGPGFASWRRGFARSESSLETSNHLSVIPSEQARRARALMPMRIHALAR